jgi:hypothetical protein
MIVHSSDDSSSDGSLAFVRSERERHEHRKRSRKSKRRLSFGDSPVKKTTGSTAKPKSIYEVLLAVIFALTHNSERHAQGAFDILASFTSSQTRKLDEDAVVLLEEVFNVLHPKLDHLFLPFIHNVDIRDSAEQYLDIAHIVPIVEAAVHTHVTSDVSKREIKQLMEPLRYLHTVLERSMRRRST